MTFKYEQPELQKLHDEGHPFFVEWAKLQSWSQRELAIQLAKERHDQLETEKRLKKWEDLAKNLIERLAKHGENTTELQQELEKIRQQRLEALAKTNMEKSAKAILNHAQWQAWAEPVWEENPRWFKNAVAAQIIDDHNIKVATQTVADVLIKPKSD